MPIKHRRRDRRRAVDAYADGHDLPLILFEPAAHFDAAIVGLVEGVGQDPAVLYDQATVLAALARDLGSEDDALEWFSYNTLGSYLGPHTPRFLVRLR